MCFNEGNVRSWNKKASSFLIFRRCGLISLSCVLIKKKVRSWNKKVYTFTIFRLRRVHILCFKETLSIVQGVSEFRERLQFRAGLRAVKDPFISATIFLKNSCYPKRIFFAPMAEECLIQTWVCQGAMNVAVCGSVCFAIYWGRGVNCQIKHTF